MAESQIQNVIIIDIDGLRRDVLYNTLAEDSLREESKKSLPNLSKIAGKIHLEDIRQSNEINLYGDYDVTSSDSLVVNRCVSVFPSYTFIRHRQRYLPVYFLKIMASPRIFILIELEHH